MITLKSRLAAFALLFGAATAPALAESSAASLASQSVSTSVGSLSASVTNSSEALSKNDVAQGDYQVINVAAAPDKPGTVRLTLQAVAGGGGQGEFLLDLPEQTVQQARLAQGHVVTASRRPYGLEFATGHTREAFFLALDDEWYRELRPNAVL